MQRADWQAEAQAVRAVAEAIERVLHDHCKPAVDEAVLWRGVLWSGEPNVTRAVFDDALRALEMRGIVRRAGYRVFKKGN